VARELVLDYIIERKRMDDLCGSIIDGRFREQKVSLSCDSSIVAFHEVVKLQLLREEKMNFNLLMLFQREIVSDIFSVILFLFLNFYIFLSCLL